LLVEVPVGVMPTAEARRGVDGAYVQNEPALRYVGCNDAKHCDGGATDRGSSTRTTEVWTTSLIASLIRWTISLIASLIRWTTSLIASLIRFGPSSRAARLGSSIRWRKSSSRAQRPRRR